MSTTVTSTTAATTASSSSSPFSILSDDILLGIFVKLESDPGDWARLACVSARFSALIRQVCCRNKCFDSAPSVLSDLLSTADHPPGGWSTFHKLCVCCPGLLHSGVLLENSDFGLERDISSDESYWQASSSINNTTVNSSATASTPPPPHDNVPAAPSDCSWSVFDDLYLDAVYDASEVDTAALILHETEREPGEATGDVGGLEFSETPKEGRGGTVGVHPGAGAWNLSREQGNKLLASRFKEDCLYICEWPGCVHREEKRTYMLFRGVFKNFKRSRVLRTINDGNRGKIDLECAFCECRETWDLHSAFCLRRVFGYHDDGEPVVRAFVCENGHVSGAWTDRPMYA